MGGGKHRHECIDGITDGRDRALNECIDEVPAGRESTETRVD